MHGSAKSPLAARYPHTLAVIFAVFFVVLGIAPVDRDVWVAEVIPVVIVFALLLVTYRDFRFSNLAYSLMACWLFWHTVGGHYTFAHVPFGWVTELFGFERNHFDRIGHFSVGFYAYPLAELVTRKRWSGPVLASCLGVFFIMIIGSLSSTADSDLAAAHPQVVRKKISGSAEMLPQPSQAAALPVSVSAAPAAEPAPPLVAAVKTQDASVPAPVAIEPAVSRRAEASPAAGSMRSWAAARPS